MGDSLVAMADHNPGDRYLGIEVHTPGVGKLLSEVDKRGITNLKVFAEDAVQVLEDAIPPHSIDLLQIFFPDPWHKKRHHKRRLIQPDFVELIVSRLADHGRLHLATDWQPYAEHMMEVLSANAALSNTAGRAIIFRVLIRVPRRSSSVEVTGWAMGMGLDVREIGVRPDLSSQVPLPARSLKERFNDRI